MKVQIGKRNLTLILAITLLFAVLAIVLPFAFKSAAAEGNDAGDASSAVRITLNMDVNGHEQPITDDNAEGGNGGKTIEENNALNYKRRIISTAAVIDWYNKAYNVQLSLNSYRSFTGSTITSDSESFKAEIMSQYLVVTASSIGSGRFSVTIKPISGSDAKPITVPFFVNCDCSLVPTGSSTLIRVGGTVGADGKEAQDEAPWVIDNFSKIKLNLADRLIGRALYTGTGSKPAEWTTLIGIPGNESAPRVFSSVDTLQIVPANNDLGITFTGATNAVSKVIRTNPTASKRFSPQVSAVISFTSDTIKDYTFSTYGAGVSAADREKMFWEDTHYLRVHVSALSGGNSVTFCIPVKFSPANPQAKELLPSLLKFNVRSNYKYSIGDGKYYEANGSDPLAGEALISATETGYSSIIVTPKDLVEYSFPETDANKMMISLNLSDKNTDYFSIERHGEDNGENYVDAVKITAKRNGSYVVKLSVMYYDANNDSQDFPLQLTLVGYGDYKVTLEEIKNGSPVNYNTYTDRAFSELFRDGYQIVEARPYVDSENSDFKTDMIATTVNQGVLTIRPNVGNISGRQVKAKVEMDFINDRNEKITVVSSVFNIDVDAESFFQLFPGWKGWLIIAACCIAGLILILFIVWVFIHSISKHKQDELATQAPVSSYIVKLNSTIAATQAQQRMAADAMLSQASTQMLLGAGPTGTPAADPNTLQLASGIPSQPGMAMSMPGSGPAMSEPMPAAAPEGENYDELIAKYISDEELLERIFKEKYEPKGMVRRTFFKSKDLQARELDKEKKRIIERYKRPMPMDEAIMSESEIEASEAKSAPAASEPDAEPEVKEAYAVDLGFDPETPLYVEQEQPVDEFSAEKIDVDVSPEESNLRNIEKRLDVLAKELAELNRRIDKVHSESDRIKTIEEELRERIAKAEADDAQYGKDIEDLEFKLASARQKEKDRITRDINIKEEKKSRNLEELEKLRKDLDAVVGNTARLAEIENKLSSMQSEKTELNSSLDADHAKAKTEYDAYCVRLEKVRAAQELAGKVQGLTPLLVEVNNVDHELRLLQTELEKKSKESASLRSELASAKTQLMNTSDFDTMNDLNMRINEINSRISDIEKEVTKSTKRQSELKTELNGHRRRALDFIDKNDIPLESVVAADDEVLGNIEFETVKADMAREKDEAEHRVVEAQAVYDDLSASSDDVTLVAMEVASSIKDLEDEVAAKQAELDEFNAKMEEASDDDKLMMVVEQGNISDKLEELQAELNTARVEGTKRKIEAQNEYDSKVEAAKQALDEANNEFQAYCTKYDVLVNNTNPLDLILSGSGLISQEQKKREAENLKKQLEKSKNEIEQARLAAQMAQMEAEQARVDAARASDEAREEAERAAREAMEKAEQARIEAEEKARQQVEEAERARREAEEAAEKAKADAEEVAEKARQEAQDEAERARREAEEEAERVRRESAEAAANEAEEAKRRAEEEIEGMRKKAEAEAEAKRQEEEQKRKEAEERQKAEAERKAAIDKKIQVRKEQIIALRNNMKDIKGEEDAKNMREQLYTSQLTYDEDERNSTELMDFYNKTMDDITHAGEVAKLKAENAKKPQRVVKKVTERVNRIPKSRNGRPGARPGGARPAGARPSGSRPSGARPAGARPSGSRPNGARPAGARPSGARPGGTRPTRPGGTRPPTRPR